MESNQSKGMKIISDFPSKKSPRSSFFPSAKRNSPECRGFTRSGCYRQHGTKNPSNHSNAGDTVDLCDSRDLTVYPVMKLLDGNIWAMRNLNLGATTLSVDLTSSNTNLSTRIASSTFNSWRTVSGSSGSLTNPQFVPISGSDPYGSYYGVLYNYAAATANTVAGNITSNNAVTASYDLCPSGWRLPTFTTTAEIPNLRMAYGITYNAAGSRIFQSTLKFPLSGMYADDTGIQALYWSSSWGGSYVHVQYISTDHVSQGHESVRSTLGSVRCLMKNPAYNAGTYQIIFNKNDSSNSTSVQQVNVGDTINLAPNPWQRDGYTFTGWNTKADGAGTSYSDGEQVKDLAARDNAIILYAQWKKDEPEPTLQTCEDLGIPAMQNWVNKSLLNTGDAVDLCDNRDLQTYTVAKLKDGNIWMTENLNLGDIENYPLLSPLTSLNTNSNNTVDVATFNSWKKAYNTASITEGNYIPISGIDETSDTLYGTLYNYCSVSAGTLCTNGNTSNSYDDICPSGWRLPSGGINGELELLSNSYAGSNISLRSPLTSGGAAFSLSGVNAVTNYYGENNGQQGSIGNYWSSTTGCNSESGTGQQLMYKLGIDQNNVYPSERLNRGMLASVRCILRAANNQPDYGTYQIVFQKNDGTTDNTVQQVSINEATTLTPNPWTRDGYTFTSWNTAADGSGTSYDDGQSVTNLATKDNSIVLYAQWQKDEPEPDPEPRTCDDLGIPAMQNWKNSSLTSEGDTTILCDNRDLSTYKVTRLADGRVWMTENMKLDFSKIVNDISAENTNNPTDRFAAEANARPASKDEWYCNGLNDCSSGVFEYNTGNLTARACPVFYAAAGDCTDTDLFGHNIKEYGVYYNSYVATAGNVIGLDYSGSKSTEIPGDICPSGWQLPSGAYPHYYPLEPDEFTNLITAISGTEYKDGKYTLRQIINYKPANFVFAGSFYQYDATYSHTYYNKVSGRALLLASGSTAGTRMYYFTRAYSLGQVLTFSEDYESYSSFGSVLDNSDPNSGYNAYVLDNISSTNYALAGYGAYEGWGIATRCILKPENDHPSLGTYQIIFDKNDGSGDTSVQQVNVGDTVTLTANPWQRDNYTFNGWNTSADGTGTSYADEEEVSNLASRDEAIVLYAQWEVVIEETLSGGGKVPLQNFDILFSGTDRNNQIHIVNIKVPSINQVDSGLSLAGGTCSKGRNSLHCTFPYSTNSVGEYGGGEYIIYIDKNSFTDDSSVIYYGSGPTISDFWNYQNLNASVYFYDHIYYDSQIEGNEDNLARYKITSDNTTVEDADGRYWIIARVYGITGKQNYWVDKIEIINRRTNCSPSSFLSSGKNKQSS